MIPAQEDHSRRGSSRTPGNASSPASNRASEDKVKAIGVIYAK
jgi:hypothetical protein